MKMQRRYSKRELLGQLRVEYLFSTNELPGITPDSSRWEVLGAFLKAGEARAERLIETDGGLIFLQSIPHRPNTGAIYVYNEATGTFLWLRFDRDDDLNGVDFDQAVWAYRLLKWTDLQDRAGNHRAQHCHA
ncbi:MAG: hypothetical protein WCE63_24200 [Acidobacteriaceae bacterium]